MTKTQIYALVTLLMLALPATAVHAQGFSVLYNFGTNPGDPLSPQNPGTIAQGRDGNLYSTAPYGGTGTGNCNGGAKGCGAVFVITPGGTLTTLHSFTGGSDGYFPYGGLTLGTDGNFYGTTAGSIGGCTNKGANGAIFRVTPSGTLTVLYDFTGGSDGGNPLAPPIQGTDGNFYGTTPDCGSHGFGTLYNHALGHVHNIALVLR